MHKAVIFDIDGTLADSKHRLQYIEKKPKQWDKFYSEAINDKYIPAVYNKYKQYKKAGHKIIILTGRSEVSRTVTEEWLHKKEIQYDLLLLCPDKLTNTPQHKVKETIIETLIPYYKIIAAYDDNELMIPIYNKLDIPFFLVKNNKINQKKRQTA